MSRQHGGGRASEWWIEISRNCRWLRPQRLPTGPQPQPQAGSRPATREASALAPSSRVLRACEPCPAAKHGGAHREGVVDHLLGALVARVQAVAAQEGLQVGDDGLRSRRAARRADGALLGVRQAKACHAEQARQQRDPSPRGERASGRHRVWWMWLVRDRRVPFSGERAASSSRLAAQRVEPAEQKPPRFYLPQPEGRTAGGVLLGRDPASTRRRALGAASVSDARCVQAVTGARVVDALRCRSACRVGQPEHRATGDEQGPMSQGPMSHEPMLGRERGSSLAWEHDAANLKCAARHHLADHQAVWVRGRLVALTPAVGAVSERKRSNSVATQRQRKGKP